MRSASNGGFVSIHFASARSRSKHLGFFPGEVHEETRVAHVAGADRAGVERDRDPHRARSGRLRAVRLRLRLLRPLHGERLRGVVSLSVDHAIPSGSGKRLGYPNEWIRDAATQVTCCRLQWFLNAYRVTDRRQRRSRSSWTSAISTSSPSASGCWPGMRPRGLGTTSIPSPR